MIRRTIYALKREYGDRVDYYKVLSSETDHLTGVKTVTKQIHRIKKAPILPFVLKRDVSSRVSAILEDKAYSRGGVYDRSKRVILIDARDLPKGFEIRPEDYVNIHNQRWNVIEVEEFETKSTWAVTVLSIPNMPLYDEYDILVSDNVDINQLIEAEHD